MLDVEEADQFIKNLTSARIAGDIDALMALFHDDAVLRIVGFGEAAKGKDAIRTSVQGLIETFEFIEWTKVRMFVNDNDIAVRQRLKVRHTSSGKVAETETSEFLTLMDGKCISFIQYADTALVHALSQP